MLENHYYNFWFASDDFNRYIYPLFYTLHYVKKVLILKTNFKTYALKYWVHKVSFNWKHLNKTGLEKHKKILLKVKGEWLSWQACGVAGTIIYSWWGCVNLYSCFGKVFALRRVWCLRNSANRNVCIRLRKAMTRNIHGSIVHDIWKLKTTQVIDVC